MVLEATNLLQPSIDSCPVHDKQTVPMPARSPLQPAISGSLPLRVTTLHTSNVRPTLDQMPQGSQGQRNKTPRAGERSVGSSVSGEEQRPPQPQSQPQDSEERDNRHPRSWVSIPIPSNRNEGTQASKVRARVPMTACLLDDSYPPRRPTHHQASTALAAMMHQHRC